MSSPDHNQLLIQMADAQRAMSAERRTGTAGKILEVSVLMFARRGYAGTSMRDIAKEVDIKAASIYEYFDSKSELLHSALLHVLGEFYGHLLEGASSEEPAPQQLESVIKRHLEWQAQREVASAWDVLLDQNIVDALTRPLAKSLRANRSLYREYLVTLVELEVPNDVHARSRAEAALYLCNTVGRWAPKDASLAETAALGWSFVRGLLQADQVYA